MVAERITLFDKEALKKGKEEAPDSFEGILELYNEKYSKAVELSFDDDVELARQCDDLRRDYLPKALVLANSREDCQDILRCTLERHKDLRQEIVIKMLLFPS